MRRCAAILTVLTLALAQRAAAQDAPDFGALTDNAPTADIAGRLNAASGYRRAAEKYRDVQRRITREQWMELDDFAGDPSRGPTPAVRQTLRRLQPVISQTLIASKREFSGFGVDYAAADEASRYQHFADLRALARMLNYDFDARIDDGDTRAVAEYLLAMYRMGGHAAAENVVIGSMVGSALVAFADTRLTTALDHAKIGPAEAALLLRQLEEFKGDDPMGYSAALMREQALLTESIARRFSGSDGVERFRAEYASWFGDDAAAAAAMDELTPESLHAMLTAFSTATGRMAQAFADRDLTRGDAVMAEIKDEIAESPFAPLAASIVALDGARLRDLKNRTRAMLDDRIATLTGIASGEIDPMSLANAAVWYIRATREMEGIDPDKRRAIDAYAAKYDAPADAALTAILNRHDVQSVVATLRTAANMSRCDWSYALFGAELFLPYHAGLLWCGRLLTADAARLLHEQQYDEAAIRMAIGYRLACDAATDGTIAGALTAHRVFNDIDALAAAAIDARMLSADGIAILSAQVGNFSRGDPFHYQPAIAAMRSGQAYPMRYFVQGLPPSLPDPTSEQVDRAAAILDGLDADRVLSLAMVHAHWETAFYKRKIDLHLACAGLESIMNVQAMRDAAAFAPALTEWARTGQMEQVRTAAYPSIAPLSQRAKQSLADFRKAVLRYEGGAAGR